MAFLSARVLVRVSDVTCKTKVPCCAVRVPVCGSETGGERERERRESRASAERHGDGAGSAAASASWGGNLKQLANIFIYFFIFLNLGHRCEKTDGAFALLART